MKTPRRPIKTKNVTVPAVYEVRHGTHFPRFVAFVATKDEAIALCEQQFGRSYLVAAWALPEDVESVRAEVLAAQAG